MPKVTVQAVELAVPAGATVLQARELAGKEVPRLCSHQRRMPTRFGTLFLAACSFAAATGAYAKPASSVEAGSMRRYAETPITAREIGTPIVRKRFATCVYGFSSTDVDAFLANQDYEGGWVKLARARRGAPAAPDSVLGRCLGREGGGDDSIAHFNAPTFRLMMAEEAYLSRFASVPSLPADAPEVLNRVPLTVGDDSGANAYLSAVADCIIYRDTPGADQLVRARAGSPEERAAAASLAGSFGACLPKDRTLRLNAQMMRSLAVEGLWARYARTVQ